MKQTRCQGVVLTPTGEIQNKELAGPPTIAEWLKSFDLMAVAFLMTNILGLGTLDTIQE